MEKPVKYSVEWLVHGGDNAFFCSKLIAGLSSAVSAGLVRVSFKNSRALLHDSPPVSLWEIVRLSDGSRRMVALDTIDSAKHFNEPVLNDCNLYFKRGFVSSYIGENFARYRSKILPLGLVHSCLGKPAVLKHIEFVIRSFFAGATRQGRAPNREDFARLLAGLKLTRGLPSPERFHFHATDTRRPGVIFQTRVWPPQKSDDSLDSVNSERIGLVKALREGLGTSFTGGVVQDAYAQQICPDVVIGSNTYRGDYAQFSRRFTVGVYSRGIHDSLAFKLSEYLAGGLCIVSPPFVHELPVPLEQGKHYLEYASERECVEMCLTLLRNPVMAEEMSAANLQFYKQWVEPKAHVLNILDRAFGTDALRYVK